MWTTDYRRRGAGQNAGLRLRIFFWQNILSPHQSSFLRALVEEGHDVTLVTCEAMTADREALGWIVPDLGCAEVFINPDLKTIQDLISRGGNDGIHIIAGARWTPLGDEALRQCRKLGRRLGVLTEAPDPRGLAGPLRWGKYTAERLVHGWHYDFVLAMGAMGVRWFRQCGYPTSKLFPFAYVTEMPSPLIAPVSVDGFAILYVGQFISRKGLDILLRAFAAEGSLGVQLRLLGDGPEVSALQGLAIQLGIADRVIWLPKQNAAGVQREMAKADVTVLPSRHDGWGAVVNESLQSGTPVLCSTACGASELIRHPWLGTVFRTGSVSELTKGLHFWIERGPCSHEERVRIRDWAYCISGKSTAQYFVGIMNHIYAGAPRPIAPWR